MLQVYSPRHRASSLRPPPPGPPHFDAVVEGRGLWNTVGERDLAKEIQMTARSTRFALALAVALWTAGGASAGGAFPGKDWQEATPESQAVDAAKLKQAVAYMDANFGSEGARELVVVRNGYLIWKGPDADAFHNVWSTTKNFTSTLLGVMVDDGRCRLDDRAVKYLPHLADEYPLYAKIRLRHLASMSSGYAGETVGRSELRSPGANRSTTCGRRSPTMRPARASATKTTRSFCSARSSRAWPASRLPSCSNAALPNLSA